MRIISIVLAATALAGCSTIAPGPLLLSRSNVQQETNALQLAVGELSSNSVQIFDKKYQITETITAGVYGPVSTWYDPRTGALYVANAGNNTITEYSKGASSPSFTYSSGIKCLANVRTDRRENVYVVELCENEQLVAEFPQGVNRMLAQCTTAEYPTSVAVNSAGDVFIGETSSLMFDGGEIEEYLRQTGALSGLQGCQDQFLIGGGGMLGTPAQLLFDRSENLVVCDSGTYGISYVPPGIDILPPPYTSISNKLTGFRAPADLALNDKQNLAFVVERPGTGYGEITIVTYPGNQFVKKLGPSDGVSDAAGIAAYPIPKQ